MLTSFHVIWNFPYIQILMIIIITGLTTAVSILGPLKRIRSQGISEVIGSF